MAEAGEVLAIANKYLQLLLVHVPLGQKLLHFQLIILTKLLVLPTQQQLPKFLVNVHNNSPLGLLIVDAALLCHRPITIADILPF